MEYSGLYTGTPIASAFDSISPWEETQIYSSHQGQPLLKGYKILAKTDDEISHCKILKNTVDMINNFFWEKFKLVGINDKGNIPSFFIHLEEKNAYYHPPISNHPECFKFNNYYISFPEVVCHEFTHGVVENLRVLNGLKSLGNAGQDGAINEAIADVVGIVFKQLINGTPDNWKIGEMRNLSTPFTKKNLKTSELVYSTEASTGKTITNDNGNVHHNSQLMSHAFFLASKEYVKTNNFEAYEIMQKIWFKSAITLNNETFNGFVEKTIEVGSIKGIGGDPFAECIKEAWEKVGFKFKTTEDPYSTEYTLIIED